MKYDEKQQKSSDTCVLKEPEYVSAVSSLALQNPYFQSGFFFLHFNDRYFFSLQTTHERQFVPNLIDVLSINCL